MQIPNNPKHTLRLDQINNDHGWDNSIGSEVKSINKHYTFRILEPDEILPEGYHQISYFLCLMQNLMKGRRQD